MFFGRWLVVGSFCLGLAGTWAAPRPVDPKARAAAQELATKSAGQARVAYHSQTGKLRFFGTDAGHAIPVTVNTQGAAAPPPEEAARTFLARYAEAVGLRDPWSELRVMRSRTTSQGHPVVRFQQLYRGLPVIGGEIIVHQTPKNAVTCMIGEVMPDLSLDEHPQIDPQAAAQVAKTLCAKAYGFHPDMLVAADPKLSVLAPALIGMPGQHDPMLVWQTEVTGGTDDRPVREYVLVHALVPKVVLHFSKIYHAKNRAIYDSSHTSIQQYLLVRNEGGPPSSVADANAAYDATGATYDFYAAHFGRDSIDGLGMALISNVRYCPDSSNCPYENAYWDGAQMTFGDGMTADDVCAHELTHGVTEHESGLFYYMQSGAINEAMSDIFGEFVDLVDGLGNDSPSVRWQIGEDLPPSIGVIRDMANPPLYSQPDKITSNLYYCGTADNGGVHTNSGVANKCASLMVDGGTFNGYTIVGLGIPKAARIWYEVNCNYLTSAADYMDLDDALVQAAISLVGTTVYGGQTITLSDAQQVLNAVNAVEMDGQPISCRADEADYCPDGEQQPFDLWFDDLENPASGRWVKGYAVGGNKWYYPQNPNPYNWDATYATSGHYNLWGDNDDRISDSWIAMAQSVTIPTTASAVYLHFRHAFSFESGYDGGVIEYTTDTVTWNDAGPLIEANGYTGTLTTGSPLAGRQAFTGTSWGYISTRLNLTPLKGQQVRVRFRIGTDSSVGDFGWFIDDIRFYVCGYRVAPQFVDPMTTASGWFEFVRVPGSGGLADTSFDEAGGAIRARVSADSSHYRIVGWYADSRNWLPYGAVGTNNYVRGKFYVYATGQTNPSQLNSIPNFRLRLSNRFAVTSMLEVLGHSSATSGDEPVSLELRPSSDPSRPSLYRVDFDPIDVPQLVNNPITEGISRGFEIYALDPQDNGYVCLTESSIGVYPKSAISPTNSQQMWLATYQPGSSNAGDLDPTKPGATLDRFSLVMPTNAGEFPTRDSSTAPAVSWDSSGIMVDSTSFDNSGGRVGVVQIDFDPDVAAGQRVRIEENKQYMIRYHVTSTQQSNLNPQLRLRARTVRFAWTQKLEVGGAWAVATPEHSALAGQALPGIGCMNPDKIGGEAGGWYTLLMHSPLNLDIRPDVSGPLSARMPNLSSQPGPGEAGTSLRDLKVAFDMIDTMSPSVNAGLEAGNFKLDRIEVFSFNQIPD